MGKRTFYNPSAEEIDRACATIRSSWSEQEHRRRAGWSQKNSPNANWAPPQCSAREMGLSDDGGFSDE